MTERRRWPLNRSGWFLELGPVPDRKSSYLVLGSPHGMHSLAQVLGANEAESLADALNQLGAVPTQNATHQDGKENNQ